MANHTKGKWTVCETSELTGVEKNVIGLFTSPIGAHMAVVSTDDVASYEVRANAHVAAAGPAMLELLRELRDNAQSRHRYMQIDAVIKLAEGTGK